MFLQCARLAFLYKGLGLADCRYERFRAAFVVLPVALVALDNRLLPALDSLVVAQGIVCAALA
jgi:hypothetical protein